MKNRAGSTALLLATENKNNPIILLFQTRFTKRNLNILEIYVINFYKHYLLL